MDPDNLVLQYHYACAAKSLQDEVGIVHPGWLCEVVDGVVKMFFPFHTERCMGPRSKRLRSCAREH